MAQRFGATPVHLTDEDPRAAVKAHTEGRGVDVCVEAVGHPSALDMAIRLTRKAGTLSSSACYGERVEVHMGAAVEQGPEASRGQANVIAHVDDVLVTARRTA